MTDVDLTKPADETASIALSEPVRKATLAERREALVAECSRQRTQMSREIGGLRGPSLHGGSLINSLLGGHLKLPLTIAATALGFLAMRPAGLMPLVHTGMSLLKMAKSTLAMVRKSTV